MIIAMMATPLTLLLPGWRGPRWLTRRRRYLGVAAFAYALAHTLLYLVDEGMIERSAELESLIRKIPHRPQRLTIRSRGLDLDTSSSLSRSRFSTLAKRL